MSGPFAFAAEPEAVDWHAGPAEPVVFHDLANLFPLLEGEPFWSLAEDIRINGVREPIVMYEGKILDGRNRYLAARETGTPYPVTQYDGADPVAYVVSLNLKRRHLSESQRASVAAKIANLDHGQRADLAGRPANLPLLEPAGAPTPAPVTQAQAAQLLNVSERSVRAASRVIDRGVPGLAAAVDAGQVTVAAASEVATLPKELQAEVVAAGPDVIREAASELRAGADVEHIQRVVMEGAAAGNRPERAVRPRNPDYVDDPAFKAMAAITGACRTISARLGEFAPEFIARGFLDADMRVRGVSEIAACRDALSTLLESLDAEQAAA